MTFRNEAWRTEARRISFGIKSFYAVYNRAKQWEKRILRIFNSHSHSIGRQKDIVLVVFPHRLHITQQNEDFCETYQTITADLGSGFCFSNEYDLQIHDYRSHDLWLWSMTVTWGYEFQKVFIVNEVIISVKWFCAVWGEYKGCNVI